MRETWKEKKASRERRVGALNLKGERRKDLAKKSKAVERIDCQMRKEMKRCLMMIPAVATPFLSLKREVWTAAESDMAVSVRTKPPFGRSLSGVLDSQNLRHSPESALSGVGTAVCSALLCSTV